MNKGHKCHKLRLVSKISKDGLLEMEKYIHKPKFEAFEKQKIRELKELTSSLTSPPSFVFEITYTKEYQPIDLGMYIAMTSHSEEAMLLTRIKSICKQYNEHSLYSDE